MSVTSEGSPTDGARPLRLVTLLPVATNDRCTDAASSHPLAHPAEPNSTHPHGAPLVDALDTVLAQLHEHGATAALRADMTELLCAWAASLIRLHRTAVTPSAPAAARPAVLDDDPLPGWLATLPAVAGRAWVVRAHPTTLRMMAHARAGWRNSHWVHGGAGDEVIIVRTSTEGPARARLAPGSSMGRGDPRWDVASALDWLAVTIGPALDPEWEIDPVVAFLTAYRTLGGVAEPDRALAVARTLTTAVEWSARLLDEDASPSDADLTWLAALWARPLALVSHTARRP